MHNATFPWHFKVSWRRTSIVLVLSLTFAMKLAAYQRDIDFCLGEAARVLGSAGHAVYLDWDVTQILRTKLKFVARTGFSQTGPLMTVDDSDRGHSLYAGIELCRLPLGYGSVPLAYVSVPGDVSISDFWAVRTHDAKAVYRYLRRLVRQGRAEPAPVLAESLRRRLHENTVGFLRRGRTLLRRYGVAVKRGVLLLGEPGNGKTMACRHLRAQCLRRGLSFRTVAASQFEQACEDGNVDALFQPQRPGVVMSDDFDSLLTLRSSDGLGAGQTTLLGQLDGVRARHDVVYVFTSNLHIERVDLALWRPGRIDVVLSFPRPDAELRRRLILDCWHADIRAAIDTERAAQETEGLSFAELEEVRKLLVLRFVEDGIWDWAAALEGIRMRNRDVRPRQPIGFAARLGQEVSPAHRGGPAANGEVSPV
jgi:cell division protease FtsH